MKNSIVINRVSKVVPICLFVLFAFVLNAPAWETWADHAENTLLLGEMEEVAERAQILEWYKAMQETGKDAAQAAEIDGSIEFLAPDLSEVLGNTVEKFFGFTIDVDRSSDEHVAFYYNKIAFTYARTEDGIEFDENIDLHNLTMRSAELDDVIELYVNLPEIGYGAIQQLDRAGASDKQIEALLNFLDELDYQLGRALTSVKS